LTEKGDSILTYAAILGMSPKHAVFMKARAASTVPLKLGIKYYNKIAKLMGATPNRDCFVAGSIRREKAYIGDIDIVLLSEHERGCISRLATAGLLPQSVTE
jgi:DNA polymerase/3'-5' exonuclease PolX